MDKGWPRFALFFRFFLGFNKNTRKINVLAHIVNDADLEKIKARQASLAQIGFFSGQEEEPNKQAFIKALFAYDKWEGDAFTKALSFSYSWRKSSVEALKSFFNFIVTFFQGPSAAACKEAFLQAALTQHKRQSNALSHAAWAKNPTSLPADNPLNLLLEALAVGNPIERPLHEKQLLINAILAQNEKGESAIFNALRSCDRNNKNDPCPNLRLLFDNLEAAGCFVGPSAEVNKQAFIRAILAPPEYRSVLSEAMWQPSSLKLILNKLTQAGCFNSEETKQAFINAIFTPDRLGRTPLYYAAYVTDSLKLILNKLIAVGCFDGPHALVNKQAFIKAVFAQSEDGTSTLYNAADSLEPKLSLQLLFDTLTLAGCFEGPAGSPNQQAFINAVFAEDKYKIGVLSAALNRSCEQVLQQLTRAHCFDGPGAEENKEAFIRAVLSQNKLNKQSALSRCPNLPSFPVLIKGLSDAGCFSNDANKKAFIAAVFTPDEHGRTIFSEMYVPENFALLLEKLAEAGCFDQVQSRKNFISAVKANSNAVVFDAMNDLKSYLTLHKCLLQAGCSKEDIARLLNEAVIEKYGSFGNFPSTPFMKALHDNKSPLLIERLRVDGAVLTDTQKQKIKEDFKRQEEQQQKYREQKAEAKPDMTKIIADAKKEFGTPPPEKKPSLNSIPPRRGSGSFSTLTLFANANDATPASQGSRPKSPDSARSAPQQAAKGPSRHL